MSHVILQLKINILSYKLPSVLLHFCIWQSSYLTLFPKDKQFFPPYCGEGFEQFLDHIVFPFPQGTSQILTRDQLVYPPLT